MPGDHRAPGSSWLPVLLVNVENHTSMLSEPGALKLATAAMTMSDIK